MLPEPAIDAGLFFLALSSVLPVQAASSRPDSRPEIAMKTLPAYTEKPELAELLDKVPLLPAEKEAEAPDDMRDRSHVHGAHVVRRLLRPVHAPVRGSGDDG